LYNTRHVVHPQRYSGFHTNGFSQEDTHICFTHYNFAQYFQDIIYWTQPIKNSSFCPKKYCFIIFVKNKKKKIFFWCGLMKLKNENTILQ
jgi:hypothetical protein